MPVGLLLGAGLGVLAVVTIPVALQDMLHVPEMSPVPSGLRRPDGQGPTAMYWVTWIVPFVAGVVLAGALWVLRPLRPLVIALLIAFLGVGGLFAAVFGSLDIGGFAPS
ncbi:hypothetical protein [Prescottella subtropica]|uniref:hypothetical protein n=1 Tax=Prescottella subtropica TaxID=2545757 RepID=UPI0010F44E46|nr:hypothetical protein [Prescottella subtropica]